MMKGTPNARKDPQREIDYVKLIRILFSHWYLLLFTILAALLIAHGYLWFSPKTYSTSGILKFEEKKPELSDLVKVIGHAARTPVSLQSEKFIIHSRGILLNAIQQLDYKISFYAPGKIRNEELYPQKPLSIRLLKQDRTITNIPPANSDEYAEMIFSFKPVNHKTFSLSWNTADRKVQRNFIYGRPLSICGTHFTLQYPGPINRGTTYLFRFNSPESLLDRVTEGLQTAEAAKNSNVIKLSQTDSNPHFAADILNAVMRAYLDYDQHQKTQSATQMIRFINGQLKFLSSAVKDAESALKKHKQSAGVMDIRVSTNYTLSKLADLEAQQSLLNLQMIAIEQLKKQMTTGKDEVSLNFSLEGHVDQLLLSLIVNLNSLLSDKHMLLKTYSNSSTAVKDINAQIEQVKNAVSHHINASDQRIRKNISYLDGRMAQLNRQASALPSAEKNLISLNRNFGINEKVYSFLSEKKLETQINRAAVLPGASIIEPARLNDVPISPDKPKIYRSALISGLLTGIMLLFLLRGLNTRIYDKESVEQATNIPIAGLIRKFPEKIADDNANILDLVKPGTVFSESVRALRTYINFLATEKQHQVIAITSEISGEGKSFIAINLSSTLAMLDKKVVLVGADLRRPKLHQAFGLSNQKGLSNYVYARHDLNEIIQPTGYKNLDFISSGPIPPNPAELLQSEKIDELITALRKRYEMILIDTAPVGLVADSIPLLCKSDLHLFVIRYGKSKRSALRLPQGLASEYSLNNMLIVLNAFEENRLHRNCYKSDANHGLRHYYADYNAHENPGYYEK